MLSQTIVVLGVMLTILVLVSTLGGSMNAREAFEDGEAADRAASDEEKRAVSGEIIRAAERMQGGVAGGEGWEPSSAPPPPDAPPAEGEGQQTPDESASLVPFDGEMFAAY